MPYQVNEIVVLTGHGLGRIDSLVTKSFGTVSGQEYYEVVTGRSTVWVAVATAATHGMRPLISRTELGRYRDLLRSRPVALNKDYQQRRHELNNRQKIGTFQSACELVRDLTARTWQSPLNDVDKAMLDQAHTGLCKEWAAVDGVSLPQARSEVAALLLEARQQQA
jgi:RNA polymerase-interacting CarD/CdnL/TRCF family regulator